MSVTYESEVTIDRAPDVVFAYLTEPAKQALWSDVPMTPITPGNLRTGSSFEVHFGMGLLKATVGLEMTDVEPPTKMAWRTFKGPVDWVGQYLLAPDGAGTRVSQRGTLTFKDLPAQATQFTMTNGQIRSVCVFPTSPTTSVWVAF